MIPHIYYFMIRTNYYPNHKTWNCGNKIHFWNNPTTNCNNFKKILYKNKFNQSQMKIKIILKIKNFMNGFIIIEIQKKLVCNYPSLGEWI